MAWIESHQSLGTHLKLRRLARELRVHRAQAIGHLHFLWWWALDNAPTGDLSALAPAEIAEVAEWPGPGDVFVAALKTCGWLDPDGMIHDWMEYAGFLIQQRAKDRQRKRDARSKPVQQTPDGSPSPVRRTSGGHPADVQQTSAVPNPTQPNQDALLTQRARETFPSLAEVQTEAELRGVPPVVAEAFWNHFESSGWVDRHGNPIQSWRPKLRKWWTDEQQRRSQDRNAGRAVGGEQREIQERVQPRIL
jgi:hypothetical protein